MGNIGNPAVGFVTHAVSLFKEVVMKVFFLVLAALSLVTQATSAQAWHVPRTHDGKPDLVVRLDKHTTPLESSTGIRKTWLW